jgi:hypothetical protein
MAAPYRLSIRIFRNQERSHAYQNAAARSAARIRHPAGRAGFGLSRRLPAVRRLLLPMIGKPWAGKSWEHVMTRARILKIAVALLIATVPAVFIAFQFGDTRNALDRSLEGAGFYPLKPPSTLVGPGSIYHVSRDGKFYRTICKADEAKVEPYVVRSPSEEMIARELQKAKYSLGADPVRLINANLNGDTVESANYTLSSVSVLEIPLDRNEEIFVGLTKREACQRTIDNLLANREFVCRGQSVLLATVEYQLTSKATVGGGAQLSPEKASSIKAALEASVNANINFSNGRFTSGTGLYYGVKVNPYCISRPTDRAARRLPRGRFDRLVDFVQLDVLGW